MEISTQPASPLAVATLTLVGACGEGETVRRIPIGAEPMIVGRIENADLKLSFRGVSNSHACLRADGDHIVVQDLNSTNGTFVNGHRITTDTQLRAADVVQFANAPFHVAVEEPVVDMMCTQAEMIVDRTAALMQFDRLMSQKALTPHFQPIVTLDDRNIMGFEVLARSRIVGLESAQDLFETAAIVQQEVELSRLSRDEGMRAGQTIRRLPELFLNTHPSEMSDPRLFHSLSELRRQHPSTPITLEIHESAVTNREQMRDLGVHLKQLDMKLAYDDFGAGQARLVELVEETPDYLKFDRSLVENIHTSPAQRQKMLGTLVRMVLDLGIVPLAEGIECEEEDVVCRQLGFELAQGYLYGRPDRPGKWNLQSPGSTDSGEEA